MGDKEDGGLGGLLGKASKWLKDQGITGEDLAKAKADSDRRETEAITARDARAREGRAARTGGSHLTLSGKVEGTVETGLSVKTERDAGWLLVTVEPVDPVPLSGGSFTGISFGVPAYTGAGTYDLGPVDLGDHIIELWLEGAEEGFYWAPDYGPGVVTVSADETTADIHFVFQDPGSNSVDVQGVVQLT